MFPLYLFIFKHPLVCLEFDFLFHIRTIDVGVFFSLRAPVVARDTRSASVLYSLCSFLCLLVLQFNNKNDIVFLQAWINLSWIRVEHISEDAVHATVTGSDCICLVLGPLWETQVSLVWVTVVSYCVQMVAWVDQMTAGSSGKDTNMKGGFKWIICEF